MAELPSGTVTFLFTDIEGSTALWERDRAAMATAVERHLALCGLHRGPQWRPLQDRRGRGASGLSHGAGGGSPPRSMRSEGWQETWPEQVGSLPVRMALHTAAATPQDGDYLAQD